MIVGIRAMLTAITDRNGNTATINRDRNTNDAASVISPNGCWISLSQDSSNRVIQAADNAGRTIFYSYNSPGRL